MRCERCAGERFTKAGRDRFGRQLSRCTGCGRRVTARTGSAFSGYRFPDEVIALAVRWYLRYRLSYAVFGVGEWQASTVPLGRAEMGYAVPGRRCRRWACGAIGARASGSPRPGGTGRAASSTAASGAADG